MLLTLPRELRDAIYHVLWQDTLDITFIRDSAFGFSASHETEMQRLWRDYYGPSEGLPQWLLTNKLVLAEGLEELNRRATFSLSMPDPNPHSKYESQPHGVLPPHTAKTLHVYTRSMVIAEKHFEESNDIKQLHHWQRGIPTSCTWTLRPEDQPFIHSLMKCFSAHRQTEVLRVFLAFNHIGLIPHLIDVRSLGLAGVDKLRHFELVIDNKPNPPGYFQSFDALELVFGEKADSGLDRAMLRIQKGTAGWLQFTCGVGERRCERWRVTFNDNELITLY